jgi:hypothetical protein
MLRRFDGHAYYMFFWGVNDMVQLMGGKFVHEIVSCLDERRYSIVLQLAVPYPHLRSSRNKFSALLST